MKIRKKKVAGYEGVWICQNARSGLHALIAVHDTTLGPSLGGIRVWPFRRLREALEDVLRLAKAMTYKAAVSGLQLGGGKSVIIADPHRDKTRDLFLAMGDFINSLKGIYFAAEDSGVIPRDLDWVRERTPYVTGASRQAGGSGDPSPATAEGIYLGIKAAVREFFQEETLQGMTCAIQGIGQVGAKLARLLHDGGCNLIVTDLLKERVRPLQEQFHARYVSPEKICTAKAEIFAPCALGGVLNPRTANELKAKIVAGAANNQLANEKRESLTLHRRGILYAPDFVINAGGLIQLYVLEILKQKSVAPWLERIYENLTRIFGESRRRKVTPLAIAYEMALEELQRAKRKKSGRTLR